MQIRAIGTNASSGSPVDFMVQDREPWGAEDPSLVLPDSESHGTIQQQVEVGTKSTLHICNLNKLTRQHAAIVLYPSLKQCLPLNFQDLKAIIELVGRAAGTMAVGSNQLMTEDQYGQNVSDRNRPMDGIQQQAVGGNLRSSDLMDKENPSNQEAGLSRHQAAIARLYGRRGGVLQQLDNLLEAQNLHCKMDAFDPSTLNQLVGLSIWNAFLGSS